MSYEGFHNSTPVTLGAFLNTRWTSLGFCCKFPRRPTILITDRRSTFAIINVTGVCLPEPRMTRPCYLGEDMASWELSDGAWTMARSVRPYWRWYLVLIDMLLTREKIRWLHHCQKNLRELQTHHKHGASHLFIQFPTNMAVRQMSAMQVYLMWSSNGFKFTTLL